MTREEALQEAVRAMRHERNCLKRLQEAKQAVEVVREDYRQAKATAEQALKIVDDMQ